MTSLFGAIVGGGLFLLSVLLGVIFWVIKESKRDEQIRKEALVQRHGRRSGIGTRGREEVMKGEQDDSDNTAQQLA